MFFPLDLGLEEARVQVRARQPSRCFFLPFSSPSLSPILHLSPSSFLPFLLPTISNSLELLSKLVHCLILRLEGVLGMGLSSLCRTEMETRMDKEM